MDGTGKQATSNAANLGRAMAFLGDLVTARVAEETHPGRRSPELPRPVLVDDGSPMAALARAHGLGFDEYTVLALALAPHLRPALVDRAVRAGLDDGEGDLPQFGGQRHGESRVLFATGETACFLLAGEDIDARFAVQALFGPEHWFAREAVLVLEAAQPGAPVLSGRLTMAPDWIDRLTLGRVAGPQFSAAFPARRVETALGWDDLVLDAAAAEQLAEVLRWLRHGHRLAQGALPPGRHRPGWRVLFHGPPGTGKTLGAGLLGKASGRPVFRVDLSATVSKYIGETEKNLASLFARAEGQGWILFFDEADALFGKRTAIKDAHDRFANQEVSYLLQRVEAFDGLAILATNSRANMDDAFIGRFDSLVRFALPGPAERRRIWELAMPRDPAPADPAAFAAAMARHELAGRAIVGALHAAVLLALDEGSDVLEPRHALAGIRREIQKEGRVFAALPDAPDP